MLRRLVDALLFRATLPLLVASFPAWFLLQGLGLPSWFAGLVTYGGVGAGLLLLEHLAPRGGTGDRPAGTLVLDIGYNALNASINLVVPVVVLLPLLLPVAAQLWQGPGGSYAPPWPQGLPFLVDVGLCLLLVDFTSYWWHRLEHDPRFPLLWRLHACHHAPRYFDFWMGAHVHPLDVIIFAVLTSGVAALLGVPPATIEASMFLAGVIGAMHHLDARTDCGWLNRLLPFADHHLVHHSLDPADNGNFGNITTLFDQLFGTWIPPRPVGAVPTGAWSMAEDYPHDDIAFQLLSPFGGWWRRVHRPDPAGQPQPEESL